MIARKKATIQQAVIALGANLEQPVENLRLAATKLAALSRGPVLASSIWVTSPVGFRDVVPDFYNAVLVMHSNKSADELLQALQLMEQEMGRIRTGETDYASRTLDLDIVDFGYRISREEQLVLPHPRAHERRFVLLPLQEVLPEFRFPEREESLGQLIDQAPEIRAEKTIPLIP